MVTVQRCQTSGNLRDILELRGASITQHPLTEQESKPPRGGALEGGNHDQKKRPRPSQLPKEPSSIPSRMATAMPLGMRTTRNNNRPPHRSRRRRRPNRPRPMGRSLLKLQQQTRNPIHQQQTHSTTTRPQRIPWTRPPN